ncbi:hypothetical protein [Caulobacter sp.]|uniref:hypothetical protein n=1 Tax=Caulobacter sp. TaxID=78 RepID=UPI003BAB520D
MRKILHGVAYDTEAADFVASRPHASPVSDAAVSLYRKRDGVFFQVTADHEGVGNGLYPLTQRQARVWLERNANALVETYFGPAQESGAPRFSRGTRIAAVEVLEKAVNTHADLTRMFQKLGREVAAACDGGSIRPRYNALIDYLDEDEGCTVEDGGFLQDAIVELAVARLPISSYGEPPYHTEREAALVRRLSLDGFVVSDGVVHLAAPEELQLPEAQDEITRLLVKHGFGVAREHLSQALENHGRGNWASANSQLRSFVEGLFDAMAATLAPNGVSPGKGVAARDWLGREGFLDQSLGEWDPAGKSFVNGLMKRLHPEGSHPGLSNEDDSTFRRHVVLVSAKLWLTRFDAVRGSP